MTGGPLLFGILVAFAIFLFFMGFWRVATKPHDPIDARMQEFGLLDELNASGARQSGAGRRRILSGAMRVLYGFGVGPWLAVLLTRAAVPLTVAEFALGVIALAILGFAAGTFGMGLPLGIVLAAAGLFLPIIFVRGRADRRRRELTWQLPDALTLLVGALRAGHGLSQAMELMAQNLPPPASLEFAWVVRAVALGMPTNQALNEMAERVGSDDMALIVTAINVQTEMGGNLAQTLETISETVRERIRLFRHIRALTAQQRLSSTLLTFLPVALAVWLFFTRPEYMAKLFAPGSIRLLPLGAGVLQVVGYLIMRKIMDIEV
jgi:tight adherence protein B